MKSFNMKLLPVLLLALLLTLPAALAEDVSWQIADSSIASVSAEGVITGVAPGETTLTVTIDGVSYIIPVTVTPVCEHCGGPLEEGNHSPIESKSTYCDVQHYACTGTGHYCDPNGANPGCGDEYPCGSSNAHTPCSACGNLWCSRSVNTYGHRAPCGNDAHRPCILNGYNPGEHGKCGDCYKPLCNGDRHGTGKGSCSYHEPEPVQRCPGCGTPGVVHGRHGGVTGCGNYECSGSHNGMTCDHCEQAPGNHSFCELCDSFLCYTGGHNH